MRILTSVLCVLLSAYVVCTTVARLSLDHITLLSVNRWKKRTDQKQPKYQIFLTKFLWSCISKCMADTCRRSVM